MKSSKPFAESAIRLVKNKRQVFYSWEFAAWQKKGKLLYMKKRIYLNMLILTCLSIIVTSAFLAMTFYSGFAGQVKGELKNKAEFLKTILNLEEFQGDYLERLKLSDTDIRITLVAPNGEVLYDNTVTDESNLENHAEREEIQKAVRTGFGEEKRLSETVGKETYYYAIRLSNGNIIRTGKTTSSIYGVFISVLPQSLLIIAVILLACLIVAHSLTKKIVDPINKFDFEKNNKTYDELSPFIRTITAQKEQITAALDEITKKGAVIDAITGNMNEGLILTSKNGTVLSANKSAISVLGINTTPIGKSILETTRNVIVLEHMKTALSGENNNVILEIANRTYHIFFSSVDNGALILFLDITEKAKAEKRRREFTANVSHELKTPLTTISGYAELMSNGVVKQEDVTAVSVKMKSESDRLIALIEDIMRLSELDEADDKKSFEPFNLTDLIADVAENLNPKAEEHSITVDIPKEKHTITANRPMMFELFYNLIDNAIKYNKQGGSVTVSVTQTDKGTAISVKDTGIGVEKKHHDRIFERFYSVDKSRSKKIGGTGLGLSIVKHISAYHGGTARIESEMGKGTEIKIEL